MIKLSDDGALPLGNYEGNIDVGQPPIRDCWGEIGMSYNCDEYAARVMRWYERIARYRSLSRLLGEDDDSGPLAALARGIEEQLHKVDELGARVHDHWLRTQVVVAELDTLTARARAVPILNNGSCGGQHFAADDLREESRLCIEESQAAEEVAEKRLLASRAASLSQLADIMSRNRSGEAPQD